MFCVSFWSKSKAREVAKSTIRHPSWLYCTVTLLPPEVFYKKVFLKNFGISTGNTCIGISPLGLQLYQKENPTQVFFCEYYKFSKTSYIWEWPLFGYFNGSLLQGPNGSRSRLYDSVRLQGPSYRSSFLFLNWHHSSWTDNRPKFENLRRIPLISQLSF